MKIRVQRSDGRIETITLREGQWEVIDGQYQNRLTMNPRFDHYFTQDGYYDGWAGDVCCDEQTSHEMIDAMEQNRQIESA
jgi:hypothetical protein